MSLMKIVNLTVNKTKIWIWLGHQYWIFSIHGPQQFGLDGLVTKLTVSYEKALADSNSTEISVFFGISNGIIDVIHWIKHEYFRNFVEILLKAYFSQF